MEIKEERNWAVGCHLAGLLPVYLLNLIVPLAIWLTKKNESAFLDEQGKESVNFQISLCIYGVALVVLWFTVILIPLAFIGMGILYIADIICVIQAAMKASTGEKYQYPFSLRLIK